MFDLISVEGKEFEAQKQAHENSRFKLQEKLLNAKLPGVMKNGTLPTDKGVLKVLANRLASKLSDDKVCCIIKIDSIVFNYNKLFHEFPQSELIYPNGTKMTVKKAGVLETIPTDSFADRLFINSEFSMLFSEKYLRKQMKKGLDRAEVLTKFRSSGRHDVMKGMNCMN